MLHINHYYDIVKFSVRINAVVLQNVDVISAETGSQPYLRVKMQNLLSLCV